MINILPLSGVPHARPACISWAVDEWGAATGFSPADWEIELARIDAHPTDEIFVALIDNQPVGMAWMLEREGIETHQHLTPWLSSLVVDPAFRDRGVARALIAHVEEYVTRGGDETLYLLTETPAVYFSLGWEAFDTAPLNGNSVFVMRKALATDQIAQTA